MAGRWHSQWLQELTDANAAPTEDEARLAFAAIEGATINKRLDLAASPKVLYSRLRHGIDTGLVALADGAIQASTPKGADPPSQEALATWMASGECPADTLVEAERRLADLWGLGDGKVSVTAWAFGGLVGRADGAEFHAPAHVLLAEAVEAERQNPLAPLVRDCPIEGQPNLRPNRILPAKLGMVDPSHKRADRLLRLFSPAAHRRGQLVMPGFEVDQDGPALPLALYQLGQDNPHRGGSPAAPLALRLFVEAVLSVELSQRRSGRPVALNMTLRDLLARLYPGPRRPKPVEYWPRLMRAVEALDKMDARIPWHDPATGRGGLQRVVSVGSIPRGPDALDDNVRVVVDLPPGSGPGPLVTPTLGRWGARSATAYNALLNLAYRWFDPGVTRLPLVRGHWLQSKDPARYPELSDADVASITRPLSARAARRNLAAEGWETLRELEQAGELRIEGRRVLPPARRMESDVQPDAE